MPRPITLVVFIAVLAVLGGTARARVHGRTGAASAMAAGRDTPHGMLVVAHGPRAAAQTQGVPTVDADGSPAEHCGALRAEGLRVTLSDRDEAAYCLVDAPDVAARYVQLLNVPDFTAFAERKDQAASALRGAGVDLCRVTLWWVRRDAVREGVAVTDQYAAPTGCPPRIVAHDPVAEGWTALIEATVRDAIEQGERTLGIRPALPLTVHLHGDRAAYAARTAVGQTSAATRARLADTEGVAARGTIEGAWIALDMSRFSPAWPERAEFAVRHEVAHYLQTAAAGCACAFPAWFAEGMADVFATAATGPITTRHLAARAAEQSGRAPALRDLATYPDGDQVMSVYERGYGAASYLAERWGVGVLGNLARTGAGAPEAFERALAEQTGMSLDQLDRAAARWIVSAMPAGEDRLITPRFTGAFTRYDPATGKTEGEGTVFGAAAGGIDVAAAWDCAPGVHRIVTRWYRPDGALFYEEVSGGDAMRCSVTTRSRLSFTAAGRTGGRATDTPGRWRVDITADGRPAATLALTITS